MSSVGEGPIRVSSARDLQHSIGMAVLTLSSFHLVVLAAAIVVTAGFGLWGLLNGYAAAGALSLIVGAGLIVYGAYFAGRVKRMHLR